MLAVAAPSAKQAAAVSANRIRVRIHLHYIARRRGTQPARRGSNVLAETNCGQSVDAPTANSTLGVSPRAQHPVSSGPGARGVYLWFGLQQRRVNPAESKTLLVPPLHGDMKRFDGRREYASEFR